MEFLRGGQPLETTHADETGAFSAGFATCPSEMRVVAAADWQGGDERVRVVSDRDGNELYSTRLPVDSARESLAIDLVDETSSGAFHILDTLITGYQRYAEWTTQPSARPLPPMFAYWKPDVTTEWSYYHGRHASGRHAIELMAPRSDAPGTADSDEHDESIILHEFGHFVFDWQSPASSRGGMHPRGYRVDPSTAFEEGRATWFSCAARHVAAYVDSEGREPHGTARVNERVESPQDPRGAGSETSVAGVLWDLVDGASNIPDEDHDGVSLSPGEILSAMARVSAHGVAYRSFADTLRELTRPDSLLARNTLNEMLHATGEDPDALFAVYPLVISESQSGLIDGRSDPAPSGGRNRPDSGFDANRAYRVTAFPDSATRVRVRLAIDGVGTPSSHTDLDLFAYAESGDLIGRSVGTTRMEELTLESSQLPVVLYVHDGGGDGEGNRAHYTLSLEPLR